jgi:hypothetical protein
MVNPALAQVNTEQNYLIIVEIGEFPHFLYFFIFKNHDFAYVVQV